MFKIIEERKKNRAIKEYVNRLSPALVKRYGLLDQYTVKQIEKTASHLKLENKFLPYAIALYRYEESINTLKLYRIDQGFLNMLRREIADLLFYQNPDYDVKSVVSLSKPARWGGGRHDNFMANKHGQTGY